MKTLKPLRKKLELLAEKATFKVVMSGVIGSAPPEEALEVVDFAKAHGFTPRILLVHDENGQSQLSHEELNVYAEAKRRIGDRANEAFGYRGKMIESGEAPFKCRSGSRYLYVDEFGSVHWCYQTRELSRRTCSRTHTRTCESSSTRRRTATPNAPSAAPGPPPRRMSGALSAALQTPPLRRPYRDYARSIRIARKSSTLVSVGPVTTRSPRAANTE